jgi:amino acid permease
MSGVILITCIFSFAIYVVVAIFGLITFAGTGELSDNIIMMYPRSYITLAGEACLASMVLLSYPLLLHPARVSVDKIIDGVMKREDNHEPVSLIRHILITAGLIAGSWILAISINDLSIVLSFVGATYVFSLF